MGFWMVRLLLPMRLNAVSGSSGTLRLPLWLPAMHPAAQHVCRNPHGSLAWHSGLKMFLLGHKCRGRHQLGPSKR